MDDLAHPTRSKGSGSPKAERSVDSHCPQRWRVKQHLLIWPLFEPDT
jgi:hypothetical protein